MVGGGCLKLSGNVNGGCIKLRWDGIMAGGGRMQLSGDGERWMYETLW